MEKQPFVLSSDFQEALNLLEKSDKNLFITGRAGTGKSTLLQLFRNTTKKKAVVLAPTGVAALNVRGQTIHSFFGFPPRLIDQKDIKKRKFRKLYKNLEVLIIDEISMVRADILDCMDVFLRINREDPRPFGGVQLIFFGDLFQLPPVVASVMERQYFQTYYSTPYFFSAKVFAHGAFEFEMVELRHVYRQEQRHFLRLLDAIRLNRTDESDLEELNRRFMPDFEASDRFITLSARNATVDSINQRELAKLTESPRYFTAFVGGEFNPQLYPTDLRLELKKNAQVMFLKNDPERRFVNGTIGKITELDPEWIRVETLKPDGGMEEIEVGRAEWEILRYKMHPDDPEKIETEVVGTFEQFPLRLAWAITIHKSQGKTFDRVIIDLGRGAFEHGQTYVALSRCRTLDGIILQAKLRPQDILVDERVVEFYEQHL
ncbi:MAG: AAA family ATPase [Saprospirales bacterium]|nr:AAA family ATPase [Saprospirales bacterium]